MKKAREKRRQLLLKHDFSFLDQGYLSLAGVDEAGRGPWAGPVVASAVIVRDFSFKAHVDDSKAMTAEAREEAFSEIFEKCIVGTAIIEHAAVDEMNIFRASMMAMKMAVEKLSQAPDCILVDGPKRPDIAMKCIPIVEGDSASFSIACASVVAKVTRDRIMREYHEKYPEYGFQKHKGYGTEEHWNALQKFGPCPIHRRSFGPVRMVSGLN